MKRKDIFSKKRRSEIMSSIRGKNTKIEKRMMEELRKLGIRFEKHADLPGTPDFAVPAKKLAVFCHGDFWHGLNYKRMKPKLNSYWKKKIEGNMKRDTKVAKKLNRMGWKVVTLKGSKIEKDAKSCADAIRRKVERINTVK